MEKKIPQKLADFKPKFTITHRDFKFVFRGSYKEAAMWFRIVVSIPPMEERSWQ